MNPVIGIVLLSLFMALSLGALATLVVKYRNRWLTLKARQEANLAVDLDLATSDQLLAEMRKRPRTYLLLLPVNNMEEGCFGLSVEVHNIDAVPAAGILKVAAAMAEKELRKQGVELPDMPDLPE
jgi:hypothetical protein